MDNTERRHIVRDEDCGLYFVRRDTYGDDGFSEHWTTNRAHARKLSAEDADRIVEQLRLTAHPHCAIEPA